MQILPPPNHRGPRLLLAGLLSVGVHAAAIGLAGVFTVASPPPVVAASPADDAEPGAIIDLGFTVNDDPGTIELPPPEEVSATPENPPEPVVTPDEDLPPPPPTSSDEYSVPPPTPRRNVVTPSPATRATAARPRGSASATNPGAGGGAAGNNNGAGPGGGTGGGRWVTPKPPYPAQARTMRQTGSGSVRVQTDGAGRVVRVEMVQPIAPLLDATTINFARTRWSGPPNRTVVVSVTYELR